MSRPVAVVTGGTRGIGAATAELLAARGHDLVLGYRSREVEARAFAGRRSSDTARCSRVFAVNVFGTAACCRAAVRRMSTETGGAGGAVVNPSSRAAELGSPHEFVDYAASKAAVDTMTKGLALEVARRGVRVNAVRPGIIDTQMHASGGDPGRASRLGPAQPMGRARSAAELAEAVVWLLSPTSSYVTGVVLDVSGGR